MVNRFNTCDWNIDKKSKDLKWVAINNPSGLQPIVGKKKKTLNESEFIIAHYVCEEVPGGVFKSPLKKCGGCSIGDINLSRTYKHSEICLIQIGVAQSVDVNIVKSQVSLRSSPDKSNKLRLRSEREAIAHGLKNIQDNLQKKINNKSTSYILPSVYIEANRLNRIKMEPKYESFWSEPETQGNLDAIRSSLIDSLRINIYTDGSLSEESNQPGLVVMGCG
ncbi:hypothetical protein Glove_365g21 [Diversispora epigaea]|uniref:Uncharacterized protein n=1 Tax=Diversispora epigaea TaxID=1348612 RepID=A0A397H7S7_9GLOM|nr:hypothetical protein Glove_365g21 [Diversispora epigaea]